MYTTNYNTTTATNHNNNNNINNRIFTNDYFMELPIERYRNELQTYIQSLVTNSRSIITTTSTTSTTTIDDNDNSIYYYYYDTTILKQSIQEQIPWNQLCTYYNKQQQQQQQQHNSSHTTTTAVSSSSFVTTINKRSSILDELLTILINPLIVPTCCSFDCIVPILLLQILILQQNQVTTTIRNNNTNIENDEQSSLSLSLSLVSSISYTLSISQKRILKTINYILFRHCTIVYVYHYIPTILLQDTIVPYIIQSTVSQYQPKVYNTITTCSTSTTTDTIHIILQQLLILQNNVLYTSWMKEIQIYEQYKSNNTCCSGSNSTTTACSSNNNPIITGTIYNQFNYPLSPKLFTLFTFYQCFILLLPIFDMIDTIVNRQIHTLLLVQRKQQQHADIKNTVQNRSNTILSYTTLKYKKQQLIQSYKIREQCFIIINSIIQSSILIIPIPTTTPSSTLTKATSYTTLFKDFINLLVDKMLLQENNVQQQNRQKQQQQQHYHSNESIRLQILFIISLFEKSNLQTSLSSTTTPTPTTPKHDYYTILLRLIRERICKQIEFVLGHIVPIEATITGTCTSSSNNSRSSQQQIRIVNLCILLSYYSEIIVVCSNFDNPNTFCKAFNSYTMILQQLFASYTTIKSQMNNLSSTQQQQRKQKQPTDDTIQDSHHYDSKIAAVPVRKNPCDNFSNDTHDHTNQHLLHQQQPHRIQQLHHDMIVPFLNCLTYMLTYRGTMVSKFVMTSSIPATKSASKLQSINSTTSDPYKQRKIYTVSSPNFQYLLRNISLSFNNVNYWINSLQYCGIARICDMEKSVRIKALQEFGILGRVVYNDNQYSDNPEHIYPSYSILQPKCMNTNSSGQSLSCQFVLKLPGFSGCEQISDMATRISFSFTENIVQCCSRKSICDKDKDVSIFSPYSRDNKLPPSVRCKMMSNNQNNVEVYQRVNMNIDLMEIIFSYLPYHSLLHVRKVCSTWKSVSDTDKLWIDLYKSSYGFCIKDPAVIPKHDNLIEFNFATATGDNTSSSSTSKTTDGTVTTSNWKRFFQDRCQSEWIIRFRYNTKDMWKWKICPYVGCLHIMKTKKLMKKHLEQHVHKIEYQNQQQQIHLEKEQQKLVKQQEKVKKQHEKIKKQQEKIEKEKQKFHNKLQQLEGKCLSKRKQKSKTNVDNDNDRLNHLKIQPVVEQMKNNQPSQSSSSSSSSPPRKKRTKRET